MASPPFLNAFYRQDVPAPLPFEAIDEVPCAALDAIERRPQVFIDHLLNRAERTSTSSFDHRRFYDFRLRIRTAAGWRQLDPADGPFVSNEWSTLFHLLRRVNLRLFDPGEPMLPAPGSWAQRFDFAWGVEGGGQLRVRRRTPATDDPDALDLYRLMVRNRTPEDRLPATLVAKSAELRGLVREETTSYPLRELALEARDLLERALLLNHYLYFKTVDALAARFSVRRPDEYCGYHLTPGVVTALDVPGLVERIRARYPDFQLHPSLEEHPIAYLRPDEPLAVYAHSPPVPVVVRDVEVDDVRFRHRPYPDALRTVLEFIRCELNFVRFEIDGELRDEREAAVELVDSVPELAGTWGTRDVKPVDRARFLTKEVWTKSPGGGRSTSNMDAFRYALYDPPYSGAGERAIALFEPEIFETLFSEREPGPAWSVWSVDPKGSSYFINEWWDYCWVLFHRERREAIVVYGTATD